MKTPVLITAGATRNPIDSMRYITANASGRTGIWLAEKLHKTGKFAVHLFGSPIALMRQKGNYTACEFSSTRDLMAKMKGWIEQYPTSIVIHSSAVGDFEIPSANTGKITSGQHITLSLSPTPKILNQIQQWSPTVNLVSFKAAAPNTSLSSLAEIAQRQRVNSKSILVFANILENTQQDILLCHAQGEQYFPTRSQALQALLDYVTNGTTTVA